MPVICEGCGQRLTIPEGYRRNKIQCACGVICPVPESARQEAGAPMPKRAAAKSTPAVEEEAERWLLDAAPTSPPPSGPSRFHDPEPIAETEPMPKPAVFERRYACRRCGRMVRRQGECPDCDGVAPPTAASAEPVWCPSVDSPKEIDEEDDAAPYAVEGAEDVKCPQCCFMLPPGSVMCVRCGFHLKKRKKIAQTFQPIERVWETNASLKSRVVFFIVCSAAFFASGLLGVLNGGVELGVFICFYLFVTAMAAFAFGTFDRIHLVRDVRGRVRLIKTWRVCFFARQPRRIDVRSYEGIVSGRHRDVTVWEYWLFLFLLLPGLIPGLVWWYLVIYKISFHVSLSRDHGFPEYIVYSGWSEMQMKEIAYTLRDASGLRYDEG
jgi:hypothetical protein